MTASLIRFNNKYISAAQAIMADDCVLEGFIHNMGKSMILEIRGRLQKVLDKFEGGQILINWLEDNFNELSKDPTEEIIE
ncbi:hypothetical protein J1N35_013745 [Gossypium stocksii]|uniref:Uncharacterized protein n=1 Tax=Gossypium stocksii TaxID=47602 RepID=A0A9D3VVF5_9ROSI|nr:hypothetical protein J1N35_013745 [Gossypium stocksii]